nr:XF1762 family protein [Paenibacillus sp. PL91]
MDYIVHSGFSFSIPVPVSFYWIFIHEEMKKYLIYSDDELNHRRCELHNEGFELLWDSAQSRKQATRYMADYYPEYDKFDTVLTPVSFRQACDFINKHHRHHVAPQGMKFALGLSNGERLIGVLTAGRPVSRHRDNG